MNLQERNLSLQTPPTVGEDVKLLQRELAQLLFNLPADEVGQGVFGPGTRDAVRQFQDRFAAELRASGWPGEIGVVEAITARFINREVGRLQPPGQPTGFIVRGVVRQADARPLSGAIVVAVDQDLRGEEALGQTTTNADGQYEIRYTANQFARAEKGTADLIVRALNAAGTVLAASPTLFNAPQEATIDLAVRDTASGLPSEYERLVREIEPLLVNVTVPGLPAVTLVEKLADLKLDEIDFLAGETGIDKQKIAFLVASAGLQKKASAEQFSIPAEAFYGLAREGLPTDLPALGLRAQQERSDALDRALKDNIIPAALRDSLPSVLEQLQRLAVGLALRTPPAEGRPTLSNFLSTVLPSPDQQTGLLTLAANHVGTPEEFWKDLRAHPDFQRPGVVDRLQVTMQFALLTQNHLPLVQQLQQMDIKSTRDLVKLDAAAWTDLINKPVNGQPIGVPPGVPGATPEEKTTTYVRGIVSTLQAALPTETVAKMVEKAPDIGVEEPLRRAVGQFFSNSPDFDLRTSRVDSYAAAHADTAFKGIAPDDKPRVVEQLKRLQRVFQVSMSADTMTSLLSQGLDSAHAIANIPRGSFLSQYKTMMGGEAQAGAVYDRAVAINSRTLHLYAYLNDALNGAHPQAVNINSQAIADSVVKTIPNYKELFGSFDLCDCQQCRSVYSPAAYFVDLLEFLRNSAPNPANKTPLDVLLGRRPDLEKLTLTCENTNTTLPYVDLVNEVLESYVTYLVSLQSQKPQDPKIFAHDTGDATPQELDANPQFTLDAAYDELRKAVYPFTLPFHLHVAVARVYLEHLGSSRGEVIDTFQKDASPATARAGSAEYLKITSEEYQILTGANFDPNVPVQARPLREFYGYDSDQVGRPKNKPTITKLWKDWLADVPEFLQRTGIAYTDLVELLRTRFINPAYPQGDVLAFFLRIPLSFATLNALVQSNFANPDPKVLSALQQASMTLQDLIAWCNANFQKVTKLIVLDAPDSKCDLSVTRLQHLDGTLLDDAELSKLHRLIRLWRKVGWSAADLDRALMTLQAKDIAPDLITQLAQIKQLQNDLKVGNIQILLSFWAPIDTRGDDSLYRKLFLSKAALRVDAAFQPNPDGSVLTNSSLKISDHIPALLAALRVSASDLAAIRTDAGLDADTAPLILTNVSSIYRYAALARTLGLRIGDLLGLKTLSGINPFGSPDNTIQFASVADKERRSGFVVGQLNYLYRHVTAPPANLAPQLTTVLLLAKALREGLIKIAQDTALAPDPTGDLTRAKLALLFDAATVDQTIAMINGSAVYGAPLAALPANITFPDLIKNKASYDATNKLLRFKGAMTTAEQTALKSASSDAAFQASVNNLSQQPSTFIQNALSGFLDVKDAEKYLLRSTPSLGQDLKPVLLDANGTPTTDTTQAVTTAIVAKYSYLLVRLLPYLREQLSRTLAKQTIADALQLDSAVAQVLLETILKSQADPKEPAVADLLALAAPGLTAEYFTSNNLTGTPTVRTDPATAQIPKGTGSARWSGMLLAPGNGDFTFAVSGGTKVQIWLGGDAVPLSLQLDATTNEMVSQPVPLKAGQLYDLRLEFSKLPQDAVLELSWQSATVPKSIIPIDNLYPRAVLDNLTAAFTLLQKAALLVNTFKLTDPEIAYFSGHAKDFDGFDLNKLPLARDQAHAKQIDLDAPVLFKAWQRVSDYVALRDSLPQGEVSLIDVFGVAALDDATGKLAQVTAWDRQTIVALVDGFKLTAADLKNEVWVTRLQSCVRLIKRLGASAPQLFNWSSINLDFSQLQDVAQDIKKSVHAKYDEQSWLAVAKPLNDNLRESQRDALVAYLLPRLGLADSNQLFEFFLIDVDMSACMETSRIKQAISSVQLFVQRCLMNLEQRQDAPELSVSPSQIDTNHWQWMKHYRVWEANRKVFLYPENWIEPELRDDKSPFFKELESELLQNELTNENAETAFLNYLDKLDHVARLEICGMYWDQEANTLHVFGRTFNTPHIYYYRRLLNDTTWTPWEKVQVDIQGTEEGPFREVHLVPAIRNRRLHIFWPVLMEKADKNATAGPPHWEIQIAWSEYKSGKWSAKTVSKDGLIEPDTRPPHTLHFRALTKPDFGISVFRTELYRIDPGNEELGRISWHWGEFQFDDCRDVIRPYISAIPNPSELFAFAPPGTYWNHEMVYPVANDPASLTLQTSSKSNSNDNAAFYYSLTATPILRKTPTTFRILYLHQFRQFLLQAPFFFQDNQRTFLVTPHAAIRFIKQVAESSEVDLYKYAQFASNKVALVDGSNTLVATSSFQAGMSNWANQEDAGQSNWLAGASEVSHSVVTTNLRFETFWHPFVCEFVKSLKREGIPGLLTLTNQKLREQDVISSGPIWIDLGTVFKNKYDPTDRVDEPYPIEEVDFSTGGAYSLYNWELFFHAPLLIAARLSKSQRFEEAQRWFHYAFDPTDGSGRFWKLVPFTTADKDRIEDLLMLLSADGNLPAEQKAKKDLLIKQWEELKDHPFQPHLIARLRLSAYMKNVFMKYLDNLVAWGDQLFRQDTIESINEATQLYALAADLLGPRPQRLPRRGTVAAETYATLKDKLDKFSNALVSFENDFPFSNSVSSSTNGESSGLLGLGTTLYFCVPQNDKLLGYWDTVADRLFKIRHCMNIEGVVRELPLFEPPIDPALLVQAAAKGVDLSSVLNDLSAPLPYYRFNYILQKALELCGDLKSLSAALLAAIEKRDAEELAAIRAGHETMLLNLVTQVKKEQLDEANAAANALSKTRDSAATRLKYYQILLGVENLAIPPYQVGQDIPLNLVVVNNPDQTLNFEEREHLNDLSTASIYQGVIVVLEILESIAAASLPDITMKAGPPDITWGPMRNMQGALRGAAGALGSLSALNSLWANQASTLGSHRRRMEEWNHQSALAVAEIKQIDKQIDAANIRIAIAQTELDNHQKQIENAQQIEEFLRNKFTNEELYGWMQGEISVIYFQSYQMAYDLAKKAERTFRFERGLTESNFIQFGSWDSLRKGLLAGERLYLALKHMERAYHDQNKREYEITKHVSLQLHDPMALITLKQTGQCEVFLPESLLDADYPGDYMRRLKSVSLTLPCVVGPYTSINCTLTLLSNKTRIKSTPADPYFEMGDSEDDRFVTNFAAMQSIATSHAQNDSGLFELNFRDERYLPFEGAGVISRWRVELPKDTNAFDLNTLTDVVLHLKYTAREGGEILANAAKKALSDSIADAEGAPLMRLLSSRHEFPNEWARFLRPTDQNATSQKLTLDLSMERFPYLFRGRKLTVSKIDMFLTFKDRQSITDYGNGQPLVFTLTPEGGQGATDQLDSISSSFGGTPHKQLSIDLAPPAKLSLEVKEGDVKKIAPALREVVPPTGPNHTRLRADVIDDILYVLHYSVG